jgi:hypothetical protein
MLSSGMTGIGAWLAKVSIVAARNAMFKIPVGRKAL